MPEFNDALLELLNKLTDVVAKQQIAVETLGAKLHRLEVSIQTQSDYPLENAIKDMESK